MTHIAKYIFSLMAGLLLCSFGFGQKDWGLVNNQQWIQIYKSNMANSNYKKIKVECTVEGSIDKLMRVLNDVNNHKNWIYNTKHSYIIKRVSATEYYYYTETALPWPMQNRDAVVHIKFQRESAGTLNIVAEGLPEYLPQANGKVRVPRSANTWQVTSVAPNKIHIVYIFEADPGGHIPPWLVNTFVNKGPFESFRKLAEILKA